MTDFVEMWREAALEDALIGGMDSIPEEHQYDYQMALLMRYADDFKYGQEMKELEVKK